MKFVKRLIYVCIVALFASIIGPLGGTTPTVSAESATELSVDLGSHIRDLKMDEERGYLYAITYNSSEVIVINMDTLKIVKKILVGSNPLDMDISNGKLYVSVNGEYFVKVIDLDSRNVTQIIPTEKHPYHLAVNDSALYYSVDDQWSDIHRKDWTSSQEEPLNVSIYKPILKMDHERQLLYAAETGSTGSELSVFDATYGTKLWSWDSFEDIAVGENLFIDDEGNLYSGNRKIDPVNSKLISSVSSGAVLAVKDGFIFTSSGDIFSDDGANRVYHADRASEDYSFIYLDQNNNVYQNPYYSSVIKKTKFTPPAVTPAPLSYASGVDQIELDHPVTDWVAGRNERYLYAISEDANRLFQIDTESFEIVADRYAGSQPQNIVIRQGVIYISLAGSSHLVKIDTANETNFMAPIQELEIGTVADKVAAGSGKVFFTNFRGRVGVFDSVYAYLPGYYGSNDNDLLTDETSLYIGTGTELYQLDQATGQTIQTSAYISDGYENSLLKDEEYVYYGITRLPANNLNSILGTYKDTKFSSRILAVSGQTVLTTAAIFDRDSYSTVYRFPFVPQNAYVKKDGTILLDAGAVPSGASEYDPPAGYRLLKYNSLEQMKEQIKEDLKPVAVYAIDEDPSPQQFTGSVVIDPGKAAVDISRYRIRYYDANNQQVNGMSDDYTSIYDRKAGGYIQDDIKKNTSASVRKIGVTPMQELGYNEYKTYEESERIVRIWDEDAYFISNGSLFDTDNSANTISGRVSFAPAPGQMAGDRYAVFFYGDNGIIAEPLGWLPSNQATLTLSIAAGTPIPADAYALAVVLVDNEGNEAPGYSLIEIPDRMSTKPSPEQIKIQNNSNFDSVSVSGLKAGDVIKVYSYTGLLYGQATVSAGSSVAAVDNIILDESIPILGVSITSPGKRESFVVYKQYLYPDSSGGDSGTGGGGGGGTGGGGGGG
ncbi:hypothetical protein, partial [Paenibacillus auburnensis]|uniref:hypothetical protein n=1 Tax=Paenibacillus auburnensis TaxID=2905649 RepID=UPI003C6E6893